MDFESTVIRVLSLDPDMDSGSRFALAEVCALRVRLLENVCTPLYGVAAIHWPVYTNSASLWKIPRLSSVAAYPCAMSADISVEQQSLVFYELTV